MSAQSSPWELSHFKSEVTEDQQDGNHLQKKKKKLADRTLVVQVKRNTDDL